jgi:hypothetical protein
MYDGERVDKCERICGNGKMQCDVYVSRYRSRHMDKNRSERKFSEEDEIKKLVFRRR